MKLSKLIILVIGVLIFGTLNACRFSSKPENKNVKYNNTAIHNPADTLIYQIKNINLNDEQAKVDISYPVFENSIINQLLVSRFCKDLKGNKLKSFEEHTNSILKSFKQLNADFPERKEMLATLYSHENITCEINLPNWICLAYFNSSFSGGAHGNQFTTYLNFNPKTNETITLNRIVEINDYQNIKKEGKKIFYLLKNIKNDKELKENYFFDNGEFNLPENFYLSKGGLNFYYNSYDIQAYVYGSTLLQIPFEILTKILAPNHILIKTIQQIQ